MTNNTFQDTKIPKVQMANHNGIAIVTKGEETIIVRGKVDGFYIYNRLLTTEEVEKILEPDAYYGKWGSEKAMDRYNFIARFIRSLTREEVESFYERWREEDDQRNTF
jgi:hypothetical protein